MRRPETQRPAGGAVATATLLGRAVGRLALQLVRSHLGVVLLLVLGGGLFAATTAASAEIYEAVVDSDDIAGLDRPALELALDLRSPELDAAVTFFTDLGGPVGAPLLTTIAMVTLALLRRSWTPVVVMLVAVGGSLLMTTVGKMVVARERPPEGLAVPPYETSAAFPSGHTLNATVIAGVLAYLVLQRVHRAWVAALTVLLALAWAVTMGLSRVYLGHHWLTDVAVAWTLGLAWLAVVVVLHQLWSRGRSALAGREPGPSDEAG